MAFEMIFGLGIFSLVFYHNAKDIPKFLIGLLIVILIFIVAIQQDQIQAIQTELSEVNAQMNKIMEEFQKITPKSVH